MTKKKPKYKSIVLHDTFFDIKPKSLFQEIREQVENSKPIVHKEYKTIKDIADLLYND